MSKSAIPKPIDFLLSVPLYAKTPFEGLEAWAVVDVLYFAETYDSYCTKCKRASTFQAVAPQRPPGFTRDLTREALLKREGMEPSIPPLQLGAHTVRARCTRQNTHTQDFIFFIDLELQRDENSKTPTRMTIEKIGQQPSYGDVHLTQVKKYAHRRQGTREELARHRMRRRRLSQFIGCENP